MMPLIGRIIPACLPLLVWSVCFGGTLRTLDGRVYEGAVRFDRGGFFMVTPRTGSAVRVELANVWQAELEDKQVAAAPVSIKVNFQPAGVALPEGYVPDRGDIFGPRVNRLSYGWSADNTKGARHMGAASINPAWQTNLPLDKLKWEIALPNGVYRVRVGAGEQGVKEARYRIAAEGQTLVDAGPKGEADGKEAKPDPPPADVSAKPEDLGYVEGAAEVVVRDGRLTLSALPEAKNNCICFVEITSVVETGTALPAGVVFRNGAVAGGVQLIGGDEHQLKLMLPGQRELTVPWRQVAKVLFRPLGTSAAQRIPAGQPGVLLSRGDFFQGEYRGIENGRVRINSLIFGLSTFELNTEIMALLLQNVEPAPADYLLRSADGSVYKSRSVQVEKGNLLAEDSLLGTVAIEPRDLVELRYTGERVRWLADLTPQSVAAPPGVRQPFLANAVAGGMPMNLGSWRMESGLGMVAGAAVQYELDGTYKHLLCRAGIPAGVLPVPVVRFVVTCDGKEAYRSPPINSAHEPLNLVVNLANVKVINLRVEGLAGQSMHTPALWGDAVLVK